MPPAVRNMGAVPRTGRRAAVTFSLPSVGDEFPGVVCMGEQIRVQVIAVDPAVRVGVDDMVRVCPELTVVVDRPDVVLMVTDEVSDAVLVLLRSLSRAGRRVLLVADTLRESDVAEAVEGVPAGCCAAARCARTGCARRSGRRLTAASPCRRTCWGIC